MKFTRFILIRHAESTWNAARRWQGHGDPPLSARGQEQARDCADKLRGESADVLYCSDMLRTRETAAPIGEVLGLAAVPDSRLRELDVGNWTGMMREEIAAEAPEILERFEAGDADARPGAGETRREIRERVRGAVEDLAQRHPGARVVLVVHAGVIKALMPGVEPGNAEVLETSLQEIRSARPELTDVVTAPL